MAAGAGLLAGACGIEGRGTPDDARYWEGKRRNGRLSWANWPGYMQEDRATLKAFEQDTGIRVEYKEVIEENGPWFGRIQAPLAAGQPIGFDLMVMTNGVHLEKARRLGYLAPLDHGRLPNFAANSGLKNPTYDPGNKYTVPFVSGITGIAYNKRHVKGPVTSIEQLFDPRYKGRVGMMADPQELGNLGLLALGVDPEKSTPDDWRRAAARLRAQRDGGIVRKYYTQDYIDAVSKGEVWLTMAWSGDAFTMAGPDVAFVVPEEGGTLWTDNLCIPRTARNPVDALALMDWLYEPRNNALLTEYINYISPVPATKALVAADAAGAAGRERKDLQRLARSPLVFPEPHELERLSYFRRLDQDEEPVFQRTFEPIARGA